MNRKINLIAFLFAISFGSIFSVNAQTKIKDGTISGTTILPVKDAILELESSSRGLLFPRLGLTSTSSPAPLSAHVKGMVVYDTATAGTGATAVSPGLYYNDGGQWMRIGDPRWFYMPSVVLPVASGTNSIDLYAAYAAQNFSMPAASSAKSAGAGTLPVVPASQIEFFVTYYDNTVFSNLSITAAGVLTYTCNPSNIGENTYMNVVFKLK